ncbi:MAG: calcium/sodium antiporter [Clostridia bacterium]|nr:calcium/sodium antiporter [Clostridia bacterium]
MIKMIILIILGFVFLIKGADFLVNGASGIARKFGIPEMIVGLTIVSIGTSMPELFVSVTSSLKGFSDVSIGNVIGSNLCNLLLILGITTCIRSIKFQKNTKFIDIPFLIVITFLFFILAQDGKISTVDAIILIVLFIIFILYTIISAKKQKENDDEYTLEMILKDKSISIIKCLFQIVIGIVALKFGGDFVVENSTKIAKIIGISDKLISVTIIAIGTSLPELVTSVFAAIKGNTDMAIGNIIGSNIFNLLLIIGVSATINEITFNLSYNLDLIILFFSTVILFIIPYMGKKEYMTKWGGLTYLCMYTAYMVHLVV